MCGIRYRCSLPNRLICFDFEGGARMILCRENIISAHGGKPYLRFSSFPFLNFPGVAIRNATFYTITMNSLSL